jgi:hypothetical protein
VTFQHPALRKAPAVLGLFAALLLLPGCPLSPDSDSGDEDPPDTRPPERTSPAGAVELFEYVWAQKRHDLYDELLHDEFEYFPQSEDIDDFPWISGTSWPRTEELAIAENMFNPAFVSEETGETIDTIEMNITVQGDRNLTQPPGAVEYTTVMLATVLWAENTGATSDVILVFVLVPDPDEPGLWQIFEQRELPPIG